MFKRTRTNSSFGSNTIASNNFDDSPIFERVRIDSLEDGLLYAESTEIKSRAEIGNSHISDLSYNKIFDRPQDMSLNSLNTTTLTSKFITSDSLDAKSVNLARPDGFLRVTNKEVNSVRNISNNDIESIDFSKVTGVPQVIEKSFDTYLELYLEGYGGGPIVYDSEGRNPKAYMRLAEANQSEYYLEGRFVGEVNGHTRFILTAKRKEGRNIIGKTFAFGSKLVNIDLGNAFESNFVLYNHSREAASQLENVFVDFNEGFFSLRTPSTEEVSPFSTKINLNFIVTTHVMDLTGPLRTIYQMRP